MVLSATNKRLIVLLIDLLIAVLALVNLFPIATKAELPKLYYGIDDNSPIGLDKNNILEIGGLPISSDMSIELILDKYSSGDIMNMVVRYNDANYQITVTLEEYYSLIYILVLIIVGMSFLISAVLIILKTESQELALVFHNCMMAIFAMLMFTWGSTSNIPQAVNFAIHSIYDASFVFLPCFAIHFSSIFPEIKFKKLSEYAKYLYLFPLVALLVIIYTNFNYIYDGDISSIESMSNLKSNYLNPIIAPAFLIIMLNFGHSYYTTQNYYSKSQILWVFLGILPGPGIYVILYRLTEILFGSTLMSETTMVAILISTPMALLLSTFRGGLFDIRIIYKKSIVYSTVLLILLLAYLLAVIGLDQTFPQDNSSYEGFIYGFATITSLLILNPVKRRIQKVIDIYLFRQYSDYSIVANEFIIKSNDCLSKDQISKLAQEAINRILPLSNFSFYQYYLNNGTVELQLIGSSSTHRSTLVIRELLKSRNHGRVIARSSVIEPNIRYDGNEELLNAFDAEVCILSDDHEDLPLAIISFTMINRNFLLNIEDIAFLMKIIDTSANLIHKIDIKKKILFQQEELKKLEEINRMKSFFVSSITHDLKTPITSIMMFSEILAAKENIDHSTKQEYLRIIIGECNRLNKLIDNVLEFAKLENGVKTYEFAKFNLNELVGSVLEMMSYRLKLMKFELNVAISEEPIIINGDKEAIGSALINLLSNAMKYSIEKKIININTRISNGHAVLIIEDSGIGIAESEIDKIFMPYFRVKSLSTSQIEGTGLGLALVKHTIDAHSGKIKVQSSINKGSKFEISLPRLWN